MPTHGMVSAIVTGHYSHTYLFVVGVVPQQFTRKWLKKSFVCLFICSFARFSVTSVGANLPRHPLGGIHARACRLLWPVYYFCVLSNIYSFAPGKTIFLSSLVSIFAIIFFHLVLSY
jgi:hypothetical protein